MAIISEAYINHVARFLSPFGLERYHFPLLHIIKEKGTCTQSDLCQLTGRDKVTILRAVDYLQEHGFIERKVHPKDRRSQLLIPTSKAKSIEPHIHDAIKATNEEFFGAFDEDDRLRFFEMLDGLMDKTNSLPRPELIIYAEKRSS